MQLPDTVSMPDAPVSAEPADLVYDLRIDGRSAGYYEQCSHFADRVLAETDKRAGKLIACYSRYLTDELKEEAHSEGESALELLMLGLMLRRYAGAALRTPQRVVRLAGFTCRLQRAFPGLKPLAGAIRARALSPFMAANEHPLHINAVFESQAKVASELAERVSTFLRLMVWLGATGEFDAEMNRLIRWRLYLRSLPAAEAELALNHAETLFDWFASEAAFELGRYTRGVEQFLATEHARRGLREDWLLCGREPAEYHLNMIAAEIMNRGLREEFERATRHVVLVPGCMRGERAATCCAHGDGLDLQCSACDPECAVNRITLKMRSQGAQVYLVLHSTGFTRWLDRWQDEQETGVTAVACMLNILPGGLEMRARRIAAQCVPLDYPGCQKHWRRSCLATSLNEERLVQIVSAS